jgi:PRC-barrel domain
MPDIEKVDTWQGRSLLDRDGGRIGTIDAIYLDDRTGQPEWALVNTGLFGTKSSFVPPRPRLPERPRRRHLRS